jgi:uncharacterized protein involved in exopolysaccharide biosynthesis
VLVVEEKKPREVSLIEVIHHTTSAFRFLVSKWLSLLVVAFVLGLVGVTYAWFQKPEYVAEVTFAPETARTSSLGAYAGLAAQFGLDMAGGGGNIFEGDNLMEFLKSRMMIEKTLFSKVRMGSGQEVLIDYWARSNKLYDKWKEKRELAIIDFKKDQPDYRPRDSIVNGIVTDIRRTLVIGKLDKRTSIISASLKDNDEMFAKTFIEQLARNGIVYYVDYRSKKSRENVDILQRQFDSVKRVLSGNIVSAAASSDLNVNPTRQVTKAGIQNKQVDIQANGQLYGELLKQLELARITLQKETPFIQVIDTPKLPLEKKKLGRLKAGVLFAIFGGLAFAAFLLAKRSYRKLVVQSV